MQHLLPSPETTAPRPRHRGVRAALICLALALTACTHYPLGMSKAEWLRLTPEQQLAARTKQADVNRANAQRRAQQAALQRQRYAAMEAAEQRRLAELYETARYGDIVDCVIDGGVTDFHPGGRRYAPMPFTIARGEHKFLHLDGSRGQFWATYSPDGKDVRICYRDPKRFGYRACTSLSGGSREFSYGMSRRMDARHIFKGARVSCAYRPGDGMPRISIHRRNVDVYRIIHHHHYRGSRPRRNVVIQDHRYDRRPERPNVVIQEHRPRRDQYRRDRYDREPIRRNQDRVRRHEERRPPAATPRDATPRDATPRDATPRDATPRDNGMARRVPPRLQPRSNDPRRTQPAMAPVPPQRHGRPPAPPPAAMPDRNTGTPRVTPHARDVNPGTLRATPHARDVNPGTPRSTPHARTNDRANGRSGVKRHPGPTTPRVTRESSVTKDFGRGGKPGRGKAEPPIDEGKAPAGEDAIEKRSRR